MHLPGTVEWLYNTHSTILPFRWENVNCCPRSCPKADMSCNVCLGLDPKTDGRLINLPCLSYKTSDMDGNATCASLREARKDEVAKLNFDGKEDLSDCKSGGCPEDQRRSTTSEDVVALISDDRDESLDWQEEKKQWISAAGVSTPSDLDRKLEDMRRAAALNEAGLKELTSHVAELETFLLQLSDIDNYFVKHKRRSERLSRRRKRSRRKCDAMECCCAISDYQDSSTERPAKQGRRSLLDPQIMKSFGSLIKSSA